METTIINEAFITSQLLIKPLIVDDGCAYEASIAFLNTLTRENRLSYILAITVPENVSSIRLLKKIGLVFEKEIEVDKEMLHFYGVLTANLKTKN